MGIEIVIKRSRKTCKVQLYLIRHSINLLINSINLLIISSIDSLILSSINSLINSINNLTLNSAIQFNRIDSLIPNSIDSLILNRINIFNSTNPLILNNLSNTINPLTLNRNLFSSISPLTLNRISPLTVSNTHLRTMSSINPLTLHILKPPITHNTHLGVYPTPLCSRRKTKILRLKTVHPRHTTRLSPSHTNPFLENWLQCRRTLPLSITCLPTNRNICLPPNLKPHLPQHLKLYLPPYSKTYLQSKHIILFLNPFNQQCSHARPLSFSSQAARTLL